MEEQRYYEREDMEYAPPRVRRREASSVRRTIERSKAIFLNTCVICATAIVIAITVRVIMTLF